jgi:hypothetical protein
MARILYFCPDFPQPSGGTKTLYRHVHHLCALGYDAYIVHQQRDFRLTWHAYSAPILWLADRPQLTQDDVLVIPEVMPALMQQTQRFAGRRIVIALSWSPAYWGLSPGQSWRDFGITRVMTVSPVIQAYVRWSMGLEALLCREYVDPHLYYWEPDGKRLEVAYLTRKDRSGAWLQGVLQRRADPLDQVAWRPLQNLAEAVYAQHLRTARVYLVSHLQEGMNTSVLEAMACGCLVVGYSGIGGGVYMQGSGDSRNCVLVENGNLPALGRALEETITRLAHNPSAYAVEIANGIATARPYQDQAAEGESLAAVFAPLLRASE